MTGTVTNVPKKPLMLTLVLTDWSFCTSVVTRQANWSVVFEHLACVQYLTKRSRSVNGRTRPVERFLRRHSVGDAKLSPRDYRRRAARGPTSGTGSSNLNWGGKKSELSIPARNSGDWVFPPSAIICCMTDPAPKTRDNEPKGTSLL